MYKKLVLTAAAFVLAAMPQQANAQFLKNLGKVLLEAGEEILKDAPATTPANTATKAVAPQDDPPAATTQNKARYEIHETASTKTVIVDGGIEHLGIFRCGRAIVDSYYNSKYKGFVIDSKGDKVFDIPEGYKVCSNSFSDGGIRSFDSNRLLLYSESKKHAIICDENGRSVKEFDNVEKALGFNSGIAIIERCVKSPTKWIDDWIWYHIDADGNVLSDSMPVCQGIISYSLYPLREGLAPVRAKEGWGFRNEKGQWALQPIYPQPRETEFYTEGGFWGGLARIKSPDDGKWGYIDHEGNWVIPPTYTKCPGNFYGSYALVRDKSDRHYYIDKTGKFVWQEGEQKTFYVRDFLTTDYAIWSDNGNIYIVDTSFNKKAKIHVDTSGKVTDYSDDYFVWHIWSGESKMYDWEGNLLMECDGSIWFSAEGLCAHGNYYFNTKGEVIVKFEDTKF